MKTGYLLDHSMKCISVLDPSLPNGLCYEEDVLIEKLSFSSKSLEFKIPSCHPDARKITEGGYIFIPDKEHTELFTVLEVEENGSGYTHIWCEPIFISELGGRVVRPIELKSVTIEQAMNAVLSGSGWDIGINEGKGVRDFSFTEPITVLDAIHEISQSYKSELQLLVELKGFQIHKKRVNVYHQRGRMIRRPIDCGEMELKKVVDRKDLVTALIGIGPQKEDGSFLTFRDYIPPLPTGIEKKEDWIGDSTSKETWGNGSHIFGVFRDDHAQNPVELYRNTVRELKKRSKPRISYTLQIPHLGELGREVMIGDTFYIRSKLEPDPIKMRVIESRKSSTKPDENSIIAEQIE